MFRMFVFFLWKSLSKELILRIGPNIPRSSRPTSVQNSPFFSRVYSIHHFPHCGELPEPGKCNSTKGSNYIPHFRNRWLKPKVLMLPVRGFKQEWQSNLTSPCPTLTGASFRLTLPCFWRHASESAVLRGQVVWELMI
jgi:hypothetical protein